MLQKFVRDIDTSESTIFELQHGFGTDVIVQLSQAETGEVVDADIHLKDGVIRVTVGSPSGILRVIVIG